MALFLERLYTCFKLDPTGTALKTDAAEERNQCSGCFASYTLNAATGTCEPKVCTCSDGNAATAAAGTCLVDGQESCSSCNVTAGFHLEARDAQVSACGTCEANVCNCYSPGTTDDAGD